MRQVFVLALACMLVSYLKVVFSMCQMAINLL